MTVRRVWEGRRVYELKKNDAQKMLFSRKVNLKIERETKTPLYTLYVVMVTKSCRLMGITARGGEKFNR